jgi:hypothetical protein
MRKKLLVDIHMPPVFISQGTLCKVEFSIKKKTGGFYTNYVKVEAPDGTSLTTANWVREFGFKEPSTKTMEKWMASGMAKSVFGHTVEPDGWDSDGSPSWLLVLGMI